MNPDQLRMNPEAVRFVKHFVDQGKPVAAICHGPWMLVETGAVRGRTVTSWPSLKTDIRNAGGTWVDEEVILSNGVVTSRKPDDIPAFNREMISYSQRSASKFPSSSEKSERKHRVAISQPARLRRHAGPFFSKRDLERLG